MHVRTGRLLGQVRDYLVVRKPFHIGEIDLLECSVYARTADCELANEPS